MSIDAACAPCAWSSLTFHAPGPSIASKTSRIGNLVIEASKVGGGQVGLNSVPVPMNGFPANYMRRLRRITSRVVGPDEAIPRNGS